MALEWLGRDVWSSLTACLTMWKRGVAKYLPSVAMVLEISLLVPTPHYLLLQFLQILIGLFCTFPRRCWQMRVFLFLFLKDHRKWNNFPYNYRILWGSLNDNLVSLCFSSFHSPFFILGWSFPVISERQTFKREGKEFSWIK